MRLFNFVFLSLFWVLLLLLLLLPSNAKSPALKPYMGWSSWSLSAITNHSPYGRDWLNETRVQQQSDAMKNSGLQSHGFIYINIDSFWASDPTQTVDKYGRWTSDTTRFPNGFNAIADYVHKNGQKIGIYLNPGVAVAAVKQNTPIEGTNCYAQDIAVNPWTKGNTFGDCYQMNFSNPCAQDYINSFANLLASWGVDFLKMDAVSPGSGDNTIDDRPIIEAWNKALDATGRDIWLTVSWHLNITYADFWKNYTNGWRVEDDVECYCDTLVSWNSVVLRFADVQPWIKYAGVGGWNDLDSIDVANGNLDGLNNDEKQSYVTLWAVSVAPFYTGNDLTQLDDYGKGLLTNDEVIGVNQKGLPAIPTEKSATSQQQIWWIDNKDGSRTVAVFNLGSSTSTVTVNFSEINISGTVSIRDLWSHSNLGNFTNTWSASVVSHGSRLLTLTPV